MLLSLHDRFSDPIDWFALMITGQHRSVHRGELNFLRFVRVSFAMEVYL
jgi:hypothetical protein